MGASWTDANDGSGNTLTGVYSENGSFQVSGSVDTSVAGIYTLTYQKVNSFGDAVTLDRTVTVVAPPPPPPVTFVGPARSTGTITPWASTGGYPNGIIMDSMGNIYTANEGSDTVTKITPEGVSSVFGNTGDFPRDLVMDSMGNIYTSNFFDNTVTKITPDGTSILAWATTGGAPGSIVIDNGGNLYTANWSSNTVTKITPDGTSSTFGTTGSHPTDMTIDSNGNVYALNNGSNNITKIQPDGTSILSWIITGPDNRGITHDSLGNIYVSNRSLDTIMKISPNGIPTTIALPPNTWPTTMVVDEAGYIFTITGREKVVKTSPSGVSSIYGTTGSEPFGMVLAPNGDLYISNHVSNNITKITSPLYITLYGASTQSIAQSATGTYMDPGATWIDEIDGTGTITVASSGVVDMTRVGTYNLGYTHTDTIGNIKSIMRVVHITDQTYPVVTLSGSTNVSIPQGSTYTDLGATWIDNVDGNGTLSTASSGSVNTSTPGTYTLTYSKTDIAGNIGNTVTRTVTVTALPVSPSGAGGGGGGSASSVTSTPALVTPVISIALVPTLSSHTGTLSLSGTTASGVTASGKVIESTGAQLPGTPIIESVSPSSPLGGSSSSSYYPPIIAMTPADAITPPVQCSYNTVVPMNNVQAIDIDGITGLNGYIRDLIQYGIVDNKSAFNPFYSTTRAEFIKLLVGSLGCEITLSGMVMPWTDTTDTTAWYTKYVAYAYSRGWVDGYRDNTFRPDAPITRAEAAKVLVIAQGLIPNTNARKFRYFSDTTLANTLTPYINMLHFMGGVDGQRVGKSLNYRPDTPSKYLPAELVVLESRPL